MTPKASSKAGLKLADSAAFRNSLEEAAAAERAGQQHGAISALLQGYLPALRAETLQQDVRGERFARHLSDIMDICIETLFSKATASFSSKAEDQYVICAVGGYGRRKLAPFSDIDLLFLHLPDKETELQRLVDFILYPLWDGGMKVGQGVHTPKAAVQFAKSDMIARTAYLDARFLCGSSKLFEEFQAQYTKLRRRTKSQFVTAKLEEQGRRQIKAGETRYLIEPDVKDGKGGLRDLQTLQWLYKYVFGGAIGDHAAIDKIMEPAERRALSKAERFFWSIRVHLHDLRGSVDEKLAFDIQPQIAERLGYADRRGMTATERLMKHYFVNTVEVGRLTRILCARLEEERTKRLPHLPKFLPKVLQADEAQGKPNLRIRNGRLDFESAAKARRRSRDLFRLFRAFSKKPQIDFHPEALALVSEQVPKVTSEVRKDQTVAKLFEAILTAPPVDVSGQFVGPVRGLRVMIETGLLGKYIPALGSIVGRIDYGLYRRFTLDEHVLRCVSLLSEINAGDHKEIHPLTTRIMKNARRPYVYYLAVLLHESVWAVKEKSQSECEKLVTRISKRLGLDEDEASLVGWAAARHSLLARTSERRDLTEAHAISTFAKAVGSQQKLDLILVLSVCHLRIVGVHSWDEVTRRQISELYEATTAWFSGGEDAMRERLEQRAAAVRAETKERLSDWREVEKEQFLSHLTPHMLRCVDTDILVRFAHLAQAAEKDKAASAVTVNLRDGNLEAIVYADDRSGLLADIAGAVSNLGLSVRSVQALTTPEGKALDVFTVQAGDGSSLVDPEQTRRLHGALLEVARSSPLQPPSRERPFGDRRGIFFVEPEVRIEHQASEDATVVETEGLDRPGLLYGLAAVVADLDLMIVSAHIATYGERAVDTFYIRDRQNHKITDKKLLNRLEKRLLKVLSAGSKT